MTVKTGALGGRLPLADPASLSACSATCSFLELQFAEQLNTSLDERVRQVIVLTVGAIWHADYELYAHAAVARQAGLSESAIRTVVSGGVPADLTEREHLAQRVTRQLCVDRRLSDELYREAEITFGTIGLIDITSLIGVYHGVCITLTMFAVPAPGPIFPIESPSEGSIR